MSVQRVVLALCLWAPAWAFAWTFSPVIRVAELQQANQFAHLESSGNRAIAISNKQIAIAWEDNRSGQPQVYVAIKGLNDSSFSPALPVSDNGPAYEPAMAGLGDGRFLILWEAKDQVWARIVSAQHAGSVQQLSTQPAREATLSARGDGQVWIAWAQKAGGHYQIVASQASVRGEHVQLTAVTPVDPVVPKQDQLYPSIASNAKGVVIGWEDRRFGHTRIFTAFAPTGQGFGPLRQLNELPPKRSDVYGNGTGAMRVVLAGNGSAKVLACWLDKRDFAEGYDVYAAYSQDGGRTFYGNDKVEDMLGANQPQWHAVSAMDPAGHAVVVWDDQRDGNADLWMSWHSAAGWSDNVSPPGANGEAEQTQPAITFDRDGRLHLAFLERDKGVTAIRYMLATPSPGQFASGQ